MPRNGAGVYSLPGTYEAITGETILAAQHNDPLEDLEQDANSARPIGAGGTGQQTAITANDALNTTSSNLASSSTVDLSTASGVVVNITGTTTITALGTVASGAERVLIFAGVLIFTHNATSLILPGGANITTAAGDVAVMRSKGAGNWVCVSYSRAVGTALVSGSDASTTVKGIVELATDAETQTGTDTVRAVTPSNITAKEATAAEYRNNTADRILTTDQVWSAAGQVALTDAATIAVDMSTFFSAAVTLGGNRTLGNPTNAKPNQTGAIFFTQDGTGSRTLAFSSNWVFAGGIDPVLSTAPGTIDALFYHVVTPTFIFANLVKALS